MTIGDVISAMLRRWYIPLTVLACVALLAVLMARDGGIYTTRTVISFMRPSGTSLSPDNGSNDSSIITFAGAVVLEANDGRIPVGYSMSDAPYFGAGIREGTLVELANSGNQWVSSVNRAEIEIDIAGRSLESVHSRQQELIDEVLAIATSLQNLMVVPSTDRISASVVPLTTQIDYINPSRRTQLTAVAALLAVAALVAAWASVTVDRFLPRRRPHPRRVGSSVPGRRHEGSQP